MGFDLAYVASAFPRLLSAALLTLEIAFAATFLGLLGGTLLTMVRALKLRALNALIAALISFIFGTPLLVLIFIAYYVLPAIGLNLTPHVAGILAISLSSSVFISEIMRGGLATIQTGQIEAASALGLNPLAIWLRVVLPQLIRRIIPNLVNEFTLIVKGTALLSAITITDLFRTAQQIYASNYRPFETLLAASAIYIAINLSASKIGDRFEARSAVTRA